MTIGEALLWASKKLQDKKIASAYLDAEVILSHLLKKNREYLLTDPEKNLKVQIISQYRRLITQRQSRWPVAYLIGQKEFFGLNFSVDKNVLIPRPETELLVEAVLNYVKNQTSDSRHLIADIGAGSGAIATALKKYLPRTEIIATDISSVALKLARQNAKNNRVKIKFQIGQLLAPLVNQTVDIIVSNPPYLDAAKKKAFYQSCPDLKYEPAEALFATSGGLKHYETILEQIVQYRLKPSAIFWEIGYDQGRKITQLVKKYLPQATVEIKKDLRGLDRVAIVRLFPAHTASSSLRGVRRASKRGARTKQSH